MKDVLAGRVEGLPRTPFALGLPDGGDHPVDDTDVELSGTDRVDHNPSADEEVERAQRFPARPGRRGSPREPPPRLCTARMH